MANKENIAYAHDKGYSVDEYGRVFFNGVKRKTNTSRQRRHKPPYSRFTIRGPGGDCVSIFVHQLQAYQKYGSGLFGPGIVVRHLDNNSLNNTRENIAIGTQRENCMDVPMEKRIARAGESWKHKSKIRSRIDELIHDRFVLGYSYKRLVEKYRVPKSSISYFLNKAAYSRDRLLKEAS